MRRLLACVALAATLCAQDTRATVALFNLTGVHWHNTTYIGNVTSPLIAEDYGTGQIAWTYTGDFSTGTGTLKSLSLPPWGVSPGYPATTVVDANGISSTLAGTTNVDNLTYDFTMNFSQPLSGPAQSVSLTGGSYQFATGTYHSVSGEFDGTIIGGTVSPVPEPGGMGMALAMMLMAMGLLGRK